MSLYPDVEPMVQISTSITAETIEELHTNIEMLLEDGNILSSTLEIEGPVVPGTFYFVVDSKDKNLYRVWQHFRTISFDLAAVYAAQYLRGVRVVVNYFVANAGEPEEILFLTFIDGKGLRKLRSVLMVEWREYHVLSFRKVPTEFLERKIVSDPEMQEQFDILTRHISRDYP